MAATPTLIRVRIPGGPYAIVEIAIEMSDLGVKQTVARAVGLPVDTFGLKSDTDGRIAGFHSRLTGDWTAIALLGAPVVTQGEFYG